MPMGAPLNVFAQLSLVAENGQAISVSAENEIITVTLPNLWIGRSILKQFSNRQKRGEMLENLYSGLLYTDLAIEFRISQRIIAQLRPESRPSFLSRLFGFGRIELKIIPILLSLFKR